MPELISGGARGSEPCRSGGLSKCRYQKQSNLLNKTAVEQR